MQQQQAMACRRRQCHSRRTCAAAAVTTVVPWSRRSACMHCLGATMLLRVATRRQAAALAHSMSGMENARGRRAVSETPRR